MIDLFKVWMNDNPNFMKALSKVFESGYIGEGENVKIFENMLKKWFDNENLLVTNSGTSSLYLALDVIRETYELIPNETEVLCTALSCLATALPIKTMGFNIKWVDVDENNLNINLTDLENKLTENTRIVMLVHWGGTPVDLVKLQKIKENYFDKYEKELLVIEDSAHCFDSKINRENIGINKFNNYLCYSLQAIKFLTTGDGGILITPEDTFKQAKLKRWFGIDRDAGNSMRCIQKLDYVGFKFQPNNIMATIGMYNFYGAINNVDVNRENAKFYNENLKNIDGLKLLVNPDTVESSYWIYTILVDRKEDFKKMMKEKNISVSEVHNRMDTQPIFKEFQTHLPIMDSLEDKYICIPVGWWLSQNDLNYIVESIKGGW